MGAMAESYPILIVDDRRSTMLPTPPTPDLALEELGPHLHLLALYIFVDVMLAEGSAARILLERGITHLYSRV